MSRDDRTHLRYLVAAAWKALGTERFDTRDFLTAVQDTVAERDALREEVAALKGALDDEIRRVA